ncbi:MAG TPA: poly(R)-hydroxyalkanoic acid synthase subunit PhaE [Gammaproteobacteria bacterium]|nr:poly(R)-hydroxyalkanoic acid synthase subunit PhaE [Gammaproteobacteria bacterium]
MTTTFDKQVDWYALWIKQSKTFFEASEKNFNGLFDKQTSLGSEEQVQLMRQCLDIFKQQWEFMQLTEEQKAHQVYLRLLKKMYSDASELMFDQWSNRLKQENPIKNINELLDLWLHCCQATYQNMLHSQSFQEAYNDWMNAALRFWESTTSMKSK